MSMDLTGDKSTLVQVMAWCRQVTSHYLSNVDPELWRHVAAIGHNKNKAARLLYHVIHLWRSLIITSNMRITLTHTQRFEIFIHDCHLVTSRMSDSVFNVQGDQTRILLLGYPWGSQKVKSRSFKNSPTPNYPRWKPTIDIGGKEDCYITATCGTTSGDSVALMTSLDTVNTHSLTVGK